MFVRELVVSYRRRRDAKLSEECRSIRTPREAAALFNSILGEEAIEVFGILCLTTKHRLIAYHEISRGGIAQTLVSPREVFQAAFLAHAAAVVLGHNHPSGDPQPSGDDQSLTSRLVSAGEVMGINIVDHIVVGHDGRYFSFKEAGVVDF